MDVETLLRQIDATRAVEHRRDGYWAVWPGVDVRRMATVMIENKTRLATITGVPRQDGALRLIYHWEVGADIVNIETEAADGAIASIADLLPAADWAEREIRDYYDTTFTGRETSPPLVLRDGDPQGLFVRTADMGHDMNPATATRNAVDHERGEYR